MSIFRSKDKLAYGVHLDKGVTWAYASSGGAISSFVADNSNPENEVGATYRVHKFSSTGAQSIFFDTPGLIDVMVIAGGGGGGRCGSSNSGGGGGAGGVILKYKQYVKPGTSTIYVGQGGIGTGPTSGQDSYFNEFIAIGGGYGATNEGGGPSGGGSGGGGAYYNAGGFIVDQGFLGGMGGPSGGVSGGGGGAGEAGNFVRDRGSDPVHGGDGVQVAFEDNIPTYYAGGGVGGVRSSYTSELPTGGLGGGGNLGGSPGGSWNGGNAYFYGGGGGGAARTATSGANDGGSGYQGLVMIRYIVTGA